MSPRTRLAAAPLACLLLLTTGCPPMMPNGNGNDNSGSNGNTNGGSNANANGTNTNGANANASNTNAANSNGGGNANTNGANGNTNGTNGNTNNNGGAPAELSETQAAAIDAAFNDMVAFYTFFGSVNELTEARLAIDVLPQIDLFGDCPRVSLVNDGTTAVIAFDFKTGCGTGATGGLTVAGGLSITVTLASRTTVIESKATNMLTIDGVSYEGKLTFTQTRSGGTVTLTGQSDGVTIDGVGEVSGDLVVTINQGGRITVEGTLTVDDGSTMRAVTLDGVEVDPVSNGNFLPSAGAMAFAEGSSEIVVTFSADTPTTREVQVSINGSAEITYEVR